MEEFPDVLPDTSTMFKKWVWKDDTDMLEQISTGFQPKEKNNIFNKPKNQTRSLKLLPTASHMNFGKGKKNPSPIVKNNSIFSPKPSSKQIQIDAAGKRKITLENVKGVALDAVVERGEISDTFQQTLRNNFIDDLLSSLLLYFDVFFEKLQMENKPNVISAAQNFTKKKELQSTVKKLELAQKRLSEKYCSLLLGLNEEGHHHLLKGKKRQSQTKQDRCFYENLYAFCSQVIWISFRRTDLDIIQKELARLFRSDTFSAFARTGDIAEFRLASDLTSADVSDIKLAPSSLHRGKRPPIQSIINQRSPILVSLLPTSKDSSAYLFDRRKAMANEHGDNKTHESDVDGVSPFDSELCVGIIGEPISGFNPFTLAPFGDDEEEKPESEQESSSKSSEPITQGEG